jgi:hypothetical protein
LDADTATVCHLARKGYGSLAELNQLDTPELMDVVEYEQIQQDLELYHMQNNRST